MIPAVISLLIALIILVVCYYIVKWIVGYFGPPAPLGQIVNVVFIGVAIIIVLRFLMTILH